MYYTDKKHETGGHPKGENSAFPVQEWRMRDRLKTVSAVLALCLNIGVDPPDVIKTNPCAKEECWIDPTVTSQTPGHTPMNQIGKALQTQYRRVAEVHNHVEAQCTQRARPLPLQWTRRS
jgi:regulator-associated protein of mTOR